MKLWVKILMTVLLVMAIVVNIFFMPVGGVLMWIAIGIDIAVIIFVVMFAIWACVKVGADSERGDKQ